MCCKGSDIFIIDLNLLLGTKSNVIMHVYFALCLSYVIEIHITGLLFGISSQLGITVTSMLVDQVSLFSLLM